MMLSVAMVLGLVPNSVVQAADTEIAPVEATEYPQLYVNQTTSADVGVGEQAYFQFVPDEDGYYNFKSSQDDNKDTYGYLYNSDMEVLVSNDDGGGNGQFSLSMLMTAGETYYIGARFYSSGNSGAIGVSATKTPLADTFTITTEVVNFYPMMERSFTAEFPEGTVSESVSWTSSNPEVMTISYYGYAEALTPGTTTITAVSEISNITVSKDVTVYEPIEMVVETDYHLEGDVTYTFAPTETGMYAVNLFAGQWASCTIYNSSRQQIKYASGYNGLKAACEFAAGETYYICFDANDDYAVVANVVKLVPATGIAIDGLQKRELYVDNEAELKVVFDPENSIEESITWTTSNAEAVTVTNTGYITAVGVGTATITATTESGLTASIIVDVIQPPAIALDTPTQVVIEEADSEKYFTFIPEEDGIYRFSLLSEDVRALCRVNDADYSTSLYLNGYEDESEGEFLAGTEYRVVASCYYSDEVGAFTISVKKLEYADSITIEGEENRTYREGERDYLNVNFSPEDVIYEEVIWSSSDSNVVSVSEYGSLVAVAPGTATITATSEVQGTTDTITVTVLEVPAVQVGEVVEVQIQNGSTEYYKFTAEHSNGYCINIETNRSIYIDVRDENGDYRNGYAGESGQFILETVAGETYYIHASAEYARETYQFTIEELVEAEAVVIANGSEIQLYQGDTISLGYRFEPANAIPETVTWTSQDESIVQVTSYGDATAVANGSTVVTITSESGLTASIVVNVIEPTTVEAGAYVPVTITEPGKTEIFKFVPEEDGTYRFKAMGTVDTYGYLYNEDMDQIDSDDDSAGRGQFSITYEMKAGVTYYLGARFYNRSQVGTFNVMIKKVPAADSMRITCGEEMEVYHSQSLYFEVEFGPEECIEEEVTWSTSDEEIADIFHEGYAKFYKAGEVTLTATSENGLTASIRVTVVEPDSIQLSELKKGDYTRTTDVDVFAFTPDTDGIYGIFLKSDDSMVLDLKTPYADNYDDMEGSQLKMEYSMTAKNTYYINIAPEYDEIGSYELHVEKLVTPTAVEIENGEKFTGYKNDSVYLSAVLHPEYAYSEVISWTSSDTNIATVNASGRVALMGVGTATITATTTSGCSDTFTVVVKEPETINLEQLVSGKIEDQGSHARFVFTPEVSGYYRANVKARYRLNVYISEADSSYYSNLRKEDSEERYMEAGKTYFIDVAFQDEERTGVYELEIIPLVDPATINILDYETLVGYESERYELRVETLPENSHDTGLTFESSNPDVVGIEYDGYISLVSAGTATVTVSTDNGVKDSIEVTVLPVTELTLDTTKTIYIEKFKEQICKFTPTENGYYGIFADTKSSRYLDITVFDGYDNWNEEGHTCEFELYMQKGVTYFITSSYEDSKFGNYDICVKKLTPATSVSIEAGDAMEVTLGAYFPLEVSYEPNAAISEQLRWTSSDTNVVTVEYYGGEFRAVGAGTAVLTVTTETGLTDSITVTVKEPMILQIDTDVEVTAKPKEYVRYQFVPEESGTYNIASTGDVDPIVAVYDADNNWLGESDDYDNMNFNLTLELEKGKQYYFDFRVFGSEGGTFTAKLQKVKAIQSLEVQTYPTLMKCYEGYIENYELEGLVVKAIMEDSSVITWEYGNDVSIGGRRVDWEIKENKAKGCVIVTISCGGKSVSFEVEIVENPVSHLEIIKGEVPEIIEDSVGREEYNWFVYDIDWVYDLQIRVHFKDGTYKDASWEDEVENGIYLTVDNPQSDTPWEVGNDNHIYVGYMGVELDIPVTIIETPIEKITLISAPTREYIWGDLAWGHMNNRGEYQCYADDLEGLAFEIKYKDGTTETITSDDIRGRRINGYPYEVSNDSYNVKVGTIPVTFMYMGWELHYDVKVVESTVAKIEVVKDPNQTVYEEVFYPDFTGMQIKITYKDGSTKLVDVTHDDGVTVQYVRVDDSCLEIQEISEYSPESDEYIDCHRISYMGTSILYDKIQYTTYQRPTTVEVENYNFDLDGTKIIATYKDGSEFEFTIDWIEHEKMEYETSGYIAGFTKTSKGFLYLESWYDLEDGNAYVRIFNHRITIALDDVTEEPVPGDANGDGMVDTKDVTYIRRFIVGGYNVTIDQVAADVNNDGAVDTKDVTLIRRFIVGGYGVELK